MRNTSLVRAAIGLCVAASALTLTGCGGGNGGLVGTQGKTFFGAPKALNGGTARGYATLKNNALVAVGVEIDAAALTNLPPLAVGTVQATTGIALPAEASVSPFKEIAIAFFAAHPPAGVGDKPQFHPVFLLNPAQAPDPPAFLLENKPVAAGEVPQDHVRITDVAPGIGVAYQDPATPQAQPGWDSYGQNYFFYNGHMNAIALGATTAYLLRQEANTDIARGDIIKQPAVFPKRGFYPQRYTVHFDATRRIHVFELSDFQLRG